MRETLHGSVKVAVTMVDCFEGGFRLRSDGAEMGYTRVDVVAIGRSPLFNTTGCSLKTKASRRRIA